MQPNKSMEIHKLEEIIDNLGRFRSAYRHKLSHCDVNTIVDTIRIIEHELERKNPGYVRITDNNTYKLR